MALIAAKVTWIQSLLSELQVPYTTPVIVILCDNTSTVSLAHNPIHHSRTKHMELDLFFVREKVLTKLHDQRLASQSIKYASSCPNLLTNTG